MYLSREGEVAYFGCGYILGKGQIVKRSSSGDAEQVCIMPVMCWTEQVTYKGSCRSFSLCPLAHQAHAVLK